MQPGLGSASLQGRVECDWPPGGGCKTKAPAGPARHPARAGPGYPGPFSEGAWPAHRGGLRKQRPCPAPGCPGYEGRGR